MDMNMEHWKLDKNNCPMWRWMSPVYEGLKCIIFYPASAFGEALFCLCWSFVVSILRNIIPFFQISVCGFPIKLIVSAFWTKSSTTTIADVFVSRPKVLLAGKTQKCFQLYFVIVHPEALALSLHLLTPCWPPWICSRISDLFVPEITVLQSLVTSLSLTDNSFFYEKYFLLLGCVCTICSGQIH